MIAARERIAPLRYRFGSIGKTKLESGRPCQLARALSNGHDVSEIPLMRDIAARTVMAIAGA